MSTQRQDGYYYVRLPQGEWMVGEYHQANHGYWQLPGLMDPYKDFIFAEINENRIPSPEEYNTAKLTPIIYKYITAEVYKFNERTRQRYSVTEHDVIHTLMVPGEILNDWDEGEYNDPFWDKEGNQHSVYKFIKDTVANIRKL